MTILYNNIGKDLSRVSMPVALNEPLSLLQRLSEELEYADLLDIANHIEDPYERMVCLAPRRHSSAPAGRGEKHGQLYQLFPGIRGGVLHLWVRLGVLEVSLQALQPSSRRNLRKPQRRQRLPLRQRAGNRRRHQQEPASESQFRTRCNAVLCIILRLAITLRSLPVTQNQKTSLSGKVRAVRELLDSPVGVKARLKASKTILSFVLLRLPVLRSEVEVQVLGEVSRDHLLWIGQRNSAQVSICFIQQFQLHRAPRNT